MILTGNQFRLAGVFLENTSFRYSFRVPIRESMGLAVYSCGFQKCEPLHNWGPAMRDHYLIQYITSGKGIFEIGGQRRTLTAGDLFLISPSQLAYYCADKEEPWEYYWVTFNGTDAQRLLLNAGLSHQHPICHYGQKPALKNAILDIYNSKGNAAKNEANMIGRLYLFLGLLIEYGWKPEQHPLSGFDHVERAIQYIQYNYANNISVDDIAQNAGVSRSHLYRLFMKHLSTAPNEYLARFRINQACTLMREKKLNVSEAAYSVGFQDKLYFSRIFKKYKGIPPSKYLHPIENNEEETVITKS